MLLPDAHLLANQKQLNGVRAAYAANWRPTASNNLVKYKLISVAMRFALTIKNDFRNHKMINLRIVHAMHLLTADSVRLHGTFQSEFFSQPEPVGISRANWIQNAIEHIGNLNELEIDAKRVFSDFRKSKSIPFHYSLWHSTQLTQCIPNYFDRKLCVITSNRCMQSVFIDARTYRNGESCDVRP